jgi:hypothetical protein
MSRWLLLGTLLGIAGCTAGPTPPKAPPLPPISCRCSPESLEADELAKEAEDLVEREQWEASRAVLERCLGLAPNRPECHHLLGVVLERQDQPGLALSHYLTALRQAPGVAKYYPPPATLCATYKLYDTAEALVEAGLARLAPSTAEAHALSLVRLQVARAPDERLDPEPPPPIPPSPKFPEYPLRSGEAYTVWGAGVLLRSRDRHALRGVDLSITGVIGYTNLQDAPGCVLHRPGVADPDGCTSPIPTFWLCDTLDAPKSDCIRVLGWASNFAQIWGGIVEARKPDPEPYLDSFWGGVQPSPIPQRGARATVTGWYDSTFTLSTTGTSVDPVMGILTYKKLDWIEAPEGDPKLPGMSGGLGD